MVSSDYTLDLPSQTTQHMSSMRTPHILAQRYISCFCPRNPSEKVRRSFRRWEEAAKTSFWAAPGHQDLLVSFVRDKNIFSK